MKKFNKFVAAIALAATATAGASAETFVGDRTDFRDETIYFAMPTRFYDGDPSNNTYCWDGVNNNNDPEWRGDFKGLIEKMDYIKALGFTAIWITPVVENASGLDYHGYHAFDFQKVDPRHLSNGVSFQTVIDEAHKRKMKIILDIVLNHTGNFGEATLCPMFTKDYTSPSNHKKNMKLIRNGKLPDDYWDHEDRQYNWRLSNMKNMNGKNEDNHNYWHHYGQFNWDDPSRWWGQIAGDCVDLNTENAATTNYLVKCYTNFINMGVDGFRIDTSGHISRLAFNKAFIPQFHAAAAKVANEKRNGTPFFMFGEVCARGREVIYRNHYNCSPCYYTWAESKNYAWDSSETSWDSEVIMEGGKGSHTNVKSVDAQAADDLGESGLLTSNNAFLSGNEYHTPDYTKASNFSVIDFPMHWNFGQARDAFNIKSGDKLYNDATWNVVYVDGHDYGPDGWDTKSFGGSEAAWAENMSLMFTFRGIPCIWQGSECYFRKGSLIDKGPIEPLFNTSRAYFGGYLTGSVTTKDFAEYENATGNLAATLTHPLAQHLQRLNKIRAAVPALRKGQYSTEGCSGSMSFKRRYKDSKVDSYVLVTISGSSTFTGILNGLYKDAITGDVQDVKNGTLTATCSGQGNMRVYVLNGPGKIGTDTKYLYDKTAGGVAQKSYDGNQEAKDTKTVRDTEPYTPGAGPSVSFSPAGGSFRTETLTVTAKLSDATSGWFKVGNGSQVTLSGSESKQFTIGQGMAAGQSVTVTWSATNGTETTNNTVTYKKVDPNSGITIYVCGKDGKDISNANMHAWSSSGDEFGGWPGKSLGSMETKTIGSRKFHYYTFDKESINVIFNCNGNQTGDIKGLSGDTYFEYDGAKSANVISVDPEELEIKANPASGSTFTDKISVSLSCTGADAIYYTLDGSTPSASSTKYTGAITLTATTTIKAFAKNASRSAYGNFTYTKTNQVNPPAPSGYVAYFDNSSNWGTVNAYCWDDNHTEDNAFSGKWPGKKLTEKITWDGKELYVFHFDFDGELKNPMIIFNGNGNGQTGDMKFENCGVYNNNGLIGHNYSGVEGIGAEIEIKVFVQGGRLVIESNTNTAVNVVKVDGTYFQIPVTEGYNYYELPNGFYIVNGKKVALR